MQPRRYRMARRRYEQVITFRGGSGDHVGADIASRAGTVVDYHRLAPALSQIAPDDTRKRVSGAAGLERNDHAYGLHRVGLVLRRFRSRRTRDVESRAGQKKYHAC